MPLRAAASRYIRSCLIVASVQRPVPVRRNVAPASASSVMPFFPAGVLPSGGGGRVNPMGKTFLPSITSTMSELITAREGAAGILTPNEKRTIKTAQPVRCGTGQTKWLVREAKLDRENAPDRQRIGRGRCSTEG